MTHQPTFYLFRHGLATLSQDGYGDEMFTAQVLPQGQAAVEALAEFMIDQPEPDAFWCSPILRCQQTADQVRAATGQFYRVDDRLMDQHQESFSAVHDRVAAFLQDLNQSPQKTVWICTHGIIIAALTQFITTGQFSEAAQLDYPPPAGLRIIRPHKLEEYSFEE